MESHPKTASLLSFSLQRPLRSTSGIAPCLSTRLPLREHPSERAAIDLYPSKAPRWNPATCRVYRLLDPELSEPLVSLSRMFLAAGLSPLEGLIRFGLQRPQYDTVVGGLAPFADIWLPLAEARSIASSLDLSNELAAILDLSSKGAYSIQDKTASCMTHNWRIPSSSILPEEYSTEAMLATPFTHLQMLPKASHVRTQISDIPEASRRAGDEDEAKWDGLWSQLVEWAVREWESHLAELEEQAELSQTPNGIASSSAVTPSAPDLFVSSLFGTTMAAMELASQLPAALRPRTGTLDLAGLIIEKKHLVREDGKSTSKARLACVEAVSRLVMREWSRRPAVAGRPTPSPPPAALSRSAKQEAVSDAEVARRLAAMEQNFEGERAASSQMRAKLKAMEQRLRALESSKEEGKLAPKGAPGPSGQPGMAARPKSPTTVVPDVFHYAMAVMILLLLLKDSLSS